MRPSRLLGLLAIGVAAFSALPPAVSQIRVLLTQRYFEHYTVHTAWHAAYVCLLLLTFTGLHLRWNAKGLHRAAAALGATCAVSSVIAGAFVWTNAPTLWIVWPTYGQDFLYGACVWSLAMSRPTSKVLATGTIAVTITLGLWWPHELLGHVIGLYAIVSFFVFLWIVGMILPTRGEVGRSLRASLVACLTYLSMTQHWGLMWTSCVAIVLTELRILLEGRPSAFQSQERQQTRPGMSL